MGLHGRGGSVQALLGSCSDRAPRENTPAQRSTSCARGWLVSIACGLVACSIDATAADASEPTESPAVRMRTIAELPDGSRDLAISPNGQRLYALSADGRRVVAINCGRESDGSSRVVLEGETSDGPGRSLGCIDTSVVAILRQGAEGVVTTHRIPSAPETAAADSPLQRIPLGSDDGVVTADDRGCFLVSPTRNWLAAATRIDGNAAVLRAAVAGVRVSAFSTRNSPAIGAEASINCLTAGLADELVLVSATSESAADTLAMFSTPGGWDLLQLDTGLLEILDICSTSPSGTLFAITGSLATSDAPQPTGLWRLDAVLQDRRQAVRATLVAPLADPVALVSGGDEVLYATVENGRRLLEIRPSNVSSSQP